MGSIFHQKRTSLKRQVSKNHVTIVISISRNGLLKSCARLIIKGSEIRKKQHDFKSVRFECRMVLFLHNMGENFDNVTFQKVFYVNNFND